MKKGGKVQSTICNKFWIFNKVLLINKCWFLICVTFWLMRGTDIKHCSPPISESFFFFLERFCQKPFDDVTCF